MIPQGYKQYQRTQTETASPGELIVLLYGGAIKFLTLARQRLDGGDLEAAHRNLLRAQEIILELMISVDVSAGPVARNLFDLYEFMHRHLVEANVKKDGQMIDDVVRLLRELLPSWEQAIAASKSSQGAPAKVAAVA
ncbi:MAG TPA: flagellar export chaperone FliS [Chloroflexota bacterium]|jgi:flagellar protein FliS|nr:flagellar export chaperone FliS [Chloroflexota bacterium]